MSLAGLRLADSSQTLGMQPALANTPHTYPEAHYTNISTWPRGRQTTLSGIRRGGEPGQTMGSEIPCPPSERSVTSYERRCPRCDSTIQRPNLGDFPGCLYCGWEDYSQAVRPVTMRGSSMDTVNFAPPSRMSNLGGRSKTR